MTAARDNSLLRYMKQHEWEWIPVSQIANDTGSTLDQIEELSSISPSYKGCVEIRGDVGCIECRYIGGIQSNVRTIVEYLRNEYPEWKSANQVVSGAECKQNVQQVVGMYGYLIPVEMRRVKAHRGYGMYSEFRYIPDDRRALISEHSMQSEAMRRDLSIARRNRILDVLKQHNGDWVHPYTIAKELGYKSGKSVNPSLRHLRDTFGQIESMTPDGSRTMVYRYIGEADA